VAAAGAAVDMEAREEVSMCLRPALSLTRML
jgi:hypothetical protein